MQCEVVACEPVPVVGFQINFLQSGHIEAYEASLGFKLLGGTHRSYPSLVRAAMTNVEASKARIMRAALEMAELAIRVASLNPDEMKEADKRLMAGMGMFHQGQSVFHPGNVVLDNNLGGGSTGVVAVTPSGSMGWKTDILGR